MSSIADMIVQEAQRQGVDPGLALAVAAAESGTSQSGCNPISSAGAVGVFQLMPATAAGLGVDPCDLAQNIHGGILYLKQLTGKYGNDLQKVLAAYNWGPARVDAAIAAQGSNWFSAIPSGVQSYASGIISAAGTAISTAAASLFGDPFSLQATPAAAAVQPAAKAMGGTLAILGLLGIAAWFALSD